MGLLIVTVVAGALAIFDVITVDMFGLVCLGFGIWAFSASGLFLKFGFLKFFYHDVLGWHRPDSSTHWSDGCNEHATCKYCGKNIMQDSQGNWFC